MSSVPKIQQILLGFAMGCLACGFAALLFLALGSGAGIALVFALPVLIPVVVIVALAGQIASTANFIKRELEWAAWSVWLIYPLGWVSVGAYWAYIDHRTELARQEDYSSRTLAPLTDTVDVLLLIMSDRETDWSFDKDICGETCANLLRHGLLNEVAFPAPTPDLGYRVFRLAEGKACEAAEANSKVHRYLDDQYYTSARNIEQLRKRYRAVPAKLEKVNKEFAEKERAFVASAVRPRLQDTFATRILATRGHYDQCIVVQQKTDLDYDIRIDLGQDFARPYGPCCQVADIYEHREGGDMLIARWEAGDRRKFDGAWFDISDVIAVIKGREVPQKIPPYEVTSIDAELKRLLALVNRGTYFHSATALSEWIRVLIRDHSELNGEKTSALSAENLGDLSLVVASFEHRTHDDMLNVLGKSMDENALEQLERLLEILTRK